MLARSRSARQGNRVPVMEGGLRRGGHVIEVERRFEPEPRVRDPSEPLVRHHDVGPSCAALLDTSIDGDVDRLQPDRLHREEVRRP